MKLENLIVVQHCFTYFNFCRLTHVDEQVQKEALKEYYKMDIAADRAATLKKLQRFTRVTYPALCVGFIVVFWASGMIAWLT